MQEHRRRPEAAVPPALASLLGRPKPPRQRVRDLVAAPVRMVLPDPVSERLGLTSLRAERMGMVLSFMRGRCLDIGAQDNLLLRLYRSRAAALGVAREDAEASVGLDVVDWGGDCLIVPSSAALPFPDRSFDTVCFVACLNHIPERRDALAEARRVLRPDGRVLVTMINRLVGGACHRIRWWGEHSRRPVHDDEEGGLDRDETLALMRQAGFGEIESHGFFYGLNRLFVGHPAR